MNVLWLPLMASSFLVNLAYCSYLLTKINTWKLFVAEQTKSHWFIGFLMGVCQIAGLSMYGFGAYRMGNMGAILGFPVFMSMTVITANTFGWLTGEWRGSPRKAYVYGAAGLLVLVVAIVIISAPDRLSPLPGFFGSAVSSSALRPGDRWRTREWCGGRGQSLGCAKHAPGMRSAPRLAGE